jgi:hypothetical protein
LSLGATGLRSEWRARAKIPKDASPSLRLAF